MKGEGDVCVKYGRRLVTLQPHKVRKEGVDHDCKDIKDRAKQEREVGFENNDSLVEIVGGYNSAESEQAGIKALDDDLFTSDDDKDNLTLDEDISCNVDDPGALDNQSGVHVDLRLQTSQAMGRLCRLFPGAYFDHDKCGWCCRKCQAFSFPSSVKNPWVSSGVKLGDHPIRKMNKHFQSNLHKKSIEAEQLYNRPSVYEILTKHILE